MSLRILLKRAMFGFGWIVVSPLWLLCQIERRLGRGESVFTFCAQLLAPVPGYPGLLLRAAFYYMALSDCDWEVSIGYGSLFTHRGATLARHVSLGAYCIVGHADLGERAMLGSRVSIPSGKRQHFDDSGRVVHGEARFERVAVGAESWIGEGAILLADVGANCVISAGAVVVSPVPACSLAGGNPARLLRNLAAEPPAGAA